MSKILVITLLLFSLHARAETWTVATLEWPPFTCEKCPDQGIGCKVLRNSLRTAGIDVKFIFFPWSRAMKESAKSNMVGFYPGWIEDLPPGYHRSAEVFRSPVGFVEPTNKPLKWTKLEDLKGKLIGTVLDYGNTKEFNDYVASGVIKSEIVTSDNINLHKVAAGRIDGAFIDLNNAKYMLKFDSPEIKSKVHVNEKILDMKGLYLVFNGHSKDKVEKLKKALSTINAQKMVEEYLAQYFMEK